MNRRRVRIFADRRSPLRRLALSTGVVVVAICVGLGLAEGLTRLFLPAFDPSGRFEFDYPRGPLMLGQPGAVLRQVKNTGDYDVSVAINRHGLRDTKDIAEATRDDLTMVGDSFTWGWGVETDERFSDRVQAASGRRAFNLATPTNLDGYEDLLAYAESLGAKIGQVVLSVCIENDIRFYGPRPARQASAGRPGTAPDEDDWWSDALDRLDDGIDDVRQWLTERSAAYVLLTTVVHQTPWLKAAAVRLGLIVPNLEWISEVPYPPDMVESTAAKLQALSERYRLLVVLIPSRALWAGRHREAEGRLHTLLVASLRKRGVKVVDLRPSFEAGGTPLDLHFANDGHWNAKGHKMAAEAITDCLKGAAEDCR